MAFMIYSTDDGRIPAWEYYDATGLTPKVGQALKLSGGKLVSGASEAKPQFVCMREQATAVAEGDAPIPVIAVNNGMILEMAGTATVGATVKVATDGMSVTADSAGKGVVVAVPATGVVRVRFE